MEEKKENQLNFRTLKAEEIDCRINTVSAKGLTLLLYKDARVDQNILDETVGSMGWQRHHSRDNANCTVAIWDEIKQQWIEKEDTGTESYTEKEKGLASDSFKRACFNWGIGRELYSAPKIWIDSKFCDIKESDDRGKKKYTCYDSFYVSSITYDSCRNIDKLVIKHSKTKKVVFPKGETAIEEPGNDRIMDYSITEPMKITFEKECDRIGKSKLAILRFLGVQSLDTMTVNQFRTAMDLFQATPDKGSGDLNLAPPEDAEKFV